MGYLGNKFPRDYRSTLLPNQLCGTSGCHLKLTFRDQGNRFVSWTQ
uniref:Uncharacterized protein n=1 Tax=Anguilla anguilla TaxID=7936 RepID=A0A0E9WIK4_ANGAN